MTEQEFQSLSLAGHNALPRRERADDEVQRAWKRGNGRRPVVGALCIKRWAGGGGGGGRVVTHDVGKLLVGERLKVLARPRGDEMLPDDGEAGQLQITGHQ